jgi:hypothetical protein
MTDGTGGPDRPADRSADRSADRPKPAEDPTDTVDALEKKVSSEFSNGLGEDEAEFESRGCGPNTDLDLPGAGGQVGDVTEPPD